MSIVFSCPGCAKKYSVPEKFAGRSTRCQQCGSVILVPQGALTATPPAAIPMPAAAPSPWAQPDLGGSARKPWQSSRLMVAGIVGAALLVLMVGGAAAFWLFSGPSAADSMK